MENEQKQNKRNIIVDMLMIATSTTLIVLQMIKLSIQGPSSINLLDVLYILVLVSMVLKSVINIKKLSIV